MPVKSTVDHRSRSDAQAYLDIEDPNFRFGVTYDVDKSPFVELASGPTRYLLPTFATLEDERKYRKEHLALTFRILARYGLSEGINGHCSTLDPVDPTTFWVNPFGKSFRQMRASDLVRVSVATGQLVQGIRCADASATGIHAPIYRALPRGSPGAVEAITHVHGPHSKAFSALNRLPDMINQDVCAYDGEMALVPFGGVVIDDAEGTRIASYLGSDKKVAILQSHGVLCVGRLSIDEACWWQVNFEQCLQAQLLADSARRPGEDFLLIDAANRAFTKAELGTPEIGWLNCASMMEDEEVYSGGAHKL